MPLLIPLISALGGPLISLLEGVLGKHHVQNIASGAPNAVLGAVEGFSSRALLIVLGTAYVLNAGCRAATNSWIASFVQQAKGVVGL